MDQAINSFSLSPDNRKVLLPMRKNRFAIYELGKSAAYIPIDETESFGEEVPELAPAWKNNSSISCLVSEGSHFLQKQPHDRREIITIDSDGTLENIMSEKWPTNIINNFN